jgi:hypothetical protein
MDPRSNSGMMCGAESWPSRKLFRFYMALLVIRMRVLQLTWTSPVVPFSGMLALSEQCTIERWIFCFLLHFVVFP